MSDYNKNYKGSTEIPWLDPIREEDSLLKLFDQDSPDIGLFNLVDDESIKLSGSELYYYKFHRTESIDDDYMESRNKVIEIDPILLYGHYDPTVIEEALTNFGVEITNDQIFTFNRDYILRVLGRIPHSGDVIKPKFQNIKFKVVEVQEDGFEVYGIYHYVVTAQILRDSSDIVDEKLVDRSTNKGQNRFDSNS